MAEISQHSASEIIAALLVARGLGSVPVSVSPQSEWPVYIEDEPSDPDNVVTVYLTSSDDHGRVMEGERQVHFGVQIRIRSTTFSVGHLKARAIALDLDEVYQQNVMVADQSYTVHSVNRTTDVTSIGPELDSHRRLFTINALVSIVTV